MSDEVWGDASAPYGDWGGTAQLDERKTASRIEELVGLDDGDWKVVGIEIGGAENGLFDLEVVAVKRESLTAAASGRRSDESVYQASARLNRGVLPATHFRVHGMDPIHVLTRMMHVFDFRLRSRGIDGVEIQITRDDLNDPTRD